MKKWEKIFRIISIVIIIGCCLLYGGRLIYYYNKLKPAKVDGEVVNYIAHVIKSESGIAYDTDGLYLAGADYIFKGNVENNYVSYSDKIWRVSKIYANGAVKLILDKDATLEYYNNVNYQESDVYNYLNNDFLLTLTEADKYLYDMTYCSDVVTDINNITCDVKIEKQKVGLVDINDFTNSLLNGNTYFNTESAIWMMNPADETNMWVVYQNKLTKDSINERYGVRPVVILNDNVKVKSGKGTINDPYMLEV